nr:MAG TPA: tail tape measure protein [Caudoviricetes sp.]
MVAITEQTRNANKAARGTNTIMANLASVLDDTSSNGKKIKQIYDDLELSMTGMNGQMKSGYDLLSDLAGEWSGLSADTQKYIATTIAGTTQLNNFVALMNNFDHATKATETALNSAGSAAEENSRYMGGLEAQTNAVKAEFQDFANNVVPNELISAFLNLSKAILSLANNGFGAFLTRWALVSGTVLGAISMFTTLGTKVLPMVTKAFYNVAAAESAMQAASGWIGILSVAIGAIIALMPTFIDAWNESHKSVKELNEELQTMNQQLDDNKKRIEEINGLSWNERTAEINKEYYALVRQNDELERGIKLRQKEIGEKSETEEIQVGVSYGFNTGKAVLGDRPIKDIVQTEINTAKEQGRITEAVYNQEIDKINALLDTVYDSYEEAMAALENYDFFKQVFDPESIEIYKETLLGAISETKEYSAGISNVNPELEKYNSILEKNGELTEAQNEDFVILMDSAGDLYTSLKQLQTAGVATPEQNKFIENYEKLNKIYTDAVNATNNLGFSLKAIKEVSPDLYSYMEKNGFSIKNLGDYCVATGKNAKDLANSLYEVALAAKQNEIVQFGIEHAEGKKSVESGMGLSKAGKEYLAGIKSLYADISKIKSNRDSMLSQLNAATGGGGGTQKTSAEQRLETFQKQVKALDHQLAMGEISTENYYAQLQRLMDAYLQDAENQETLWKYQEKVYSYKQKMLEDETKQQEELNKEIEKQIELQEKLRDAAEALAKAQQKRILVFQKGGYGYVQDVDAISAAQAEYAKVKSGYANGTVYSSAGLHMFGENGPELGVIGSGNGVLPTDITKNLWEWGMFSPSEMFQGGFGGLGGDNLSFSGVTMSFPNVKNGNDAQGFMQSLVMLARQRAYKRY